MKSKRKVKKGEKSRIPSPISSSKSEILKREAEDREKMPEGCVFLLLLRE